jgi:hypothetical protein
MWIVRLTDQPGAYGPFDDRVSADRFRDLLGQPAEVEQLHDPVTELLNQIDTQAARSTWHGGPAWGPADEAAFTRPDVRGGPDIGDAAHHDYLREQDDRD